MAHCSGEAGLAKLPCFTVLFLAKHRALQSLLSAQLQCST